MINRKSQRKSYRIFLKLNYLLICMALLSSCTYPDFIHPLSPGTLAVSPTKMGTSNPSWVTPTPPRSSTPALNSPTPEIVSSPAPDVNSITRYELDAIFDYYQHSLSVTETIRYVNDHPETLSELVLVVEPNRWEGGFSLLSLAWGSGEVVEDYELHDNQMSIPLPDPLVSGDGLDLLISYTLDLPQIPAPSAEYRPQPYGYTARQTNIVDWYPYFPPYRSAEGWLVHPPWVFGEYQVFDVADFDVRLTLAEPVEDLVIAASAPAERDENTYVYHLDSARTFALSASDEYMVQTTSVGNVTISSYFFPYDEDAGMEVLQNTADALALFSRLIAPYPHLSLGAVEADFLDGMEYSGLFFLSNGFYNLYDGTPGGYLTFIAAHETAHQWWYGLVGNDQALEPWLDEALCTYMERVFYENVYSDYTLASGQSMLDWWWYYRVDFYDPGGWVDETIYDYRQFITYRNSVYLNGAKFLEDLRNLVGDEAFLSFLSDYARQEAYRVATANDFFAILRQNTGEDLTPLVEKYFQTVR